MGIAANGRIPGGGRDVAHQIIHPEEAGHHCGSHIQPAHIWTMYGGEKYSGTQKIHEVVGSRRGTEEE